MAQKKTVYETDIVIGGRVNRSLNGAVTQTVGLIGKLTGSSGLKGVSSNMAALSKVGIGLGVAGVAVTGVAKGIQATVNAAKEAVDAAKKYESAMANVAKVVDGLIDDQGKRTAAYTKMSKDILDLSTRIPMTAIEIAQIVEAAGQANIERDQLVRFAEAASKMGVAFDVEAEQAGRWMAVLRTAFVLTQDEAEELADQINYLGNTSSETARKIAEIVTRVGNQGKTAGFTTGEIAALAAATAGIDESIAATGIKNISRYMTAGASATKKQQDAFVKLGYTAEGVAKAMQSDASGTFLNVLKAIKELPKYEQTSIINTLFGARSSEAVNQMLGNLENLEKQLDKVHDKSLYNDSVDKEFGIRSKTFENQLQLWENTKEKFKIEVGTVILESLNENLPGTITDVQAALDEVLPELEQSLKEADIGQIIKDVADVIPSITSFIKDALPLVPGLLQVILTTLQGVVGFASGLVEILDSIVRLISWIKNSTGKDWANVFFNPTGTMPTKNEPKQPKGNPSATQKPAPKPHTSTPKVVMPDANGNLPKIQIPVTPQAKGGIVTKPTLALIGEAGENEAVIPLSKLNEMLGRSVTYSQSSTTNTASSANTYTFAPVINITGDSPQAVRQAVDDGMNEAYEQFKWLMQQYEHENDRVRF